MSTTVKSPRVLYSRKYFYEMLRDMEHPMYKNILEAIKKLHPKHVRYYGDGYPDMFEAVSVHALPNREELILTDWTEAGMAVGSIYSRYDLGTLPLYMVLMALDPNTPVEFPGIDYSWYGLQGLASYAGYHLKPIGKKTVRAGDIKRIHELLIEKHGTD